jgi:hypothetical protein
MKQTIQKLHTSPVEQPTEEPKKGRMKRPEIESIHKNQFLFNGTYFDKPECDWNKTKAQMRKEAWHELWQYIREKMHKFFETCLGELVFLCISCALIAGFIVLFLKLTGNLQ